MPYNFKRPISILEIAKYLNCKILNNNSDVVISSIERIDLAGKQDLTFSRPKTAKDTLRNCHAGACLISKENLSYLNPSTVAILSNNSEYDFCELINEFIKNKEENNIDTSLVKTKNDCLISKFANVHDSVILGHNVIIESGSIINSNTNILANTIIRKNTLIGNNCTIGSHVSIQNCKIGDRVIIDDNVVIGSTGFGFIRHKDTFIRKPHLAMVIIESNVEIGACTVIDRGFLDNTVIDFGTKIDSSVKIGHGVKVGKNCIIASQTGLSGSCSIGDGCLLAGQVGVADHVKIGKYSIVLAKSGVMTHIHSKGKVFGIPARNAIEYFRVFSKLFPSNKKNSKQ